MTKLLKTLSVVAGASIAALAIAASAQAEDIGVQASDLNLNTVQGRAELDARVDNVAREICDKTSDARMEKMRLDKNCKKIVRKKAYDMLHAEQELASREYDTLHDQQEEAVRNASLNMVRVDH